MILCSTLLIILCFLGSIDLGASLPFNRPSRCPSYEYHAKTRHEGNRSTGRLQLPFQRPVRECRNFYSWEVEETIERLRDKIRDPDLFRLFENAYPNTLDTMVKWKGFARENGIETDEDLSFVITGDM